MANDTRKVVNYTPVSADEKIVINDWVKPVQESGSAPKTSDQSFPMPDISGVLSETKPTNNKIDYSITEQYVKPVTQFFDEKLAPLFPKEKDNRKEITTKFKMDFPEFKDVEDDVLFNEVQTIAKEDPKFSDYLVKPKETVEDFKSKNPEFKEVDDYDLYRELNTEFPGKYNPPRHNVSTRINRALNTALDIPALGATGSVNRNIIPVMSSLSEGMYNLGESISRAPATISYISAIPYNAIAQSVGYPEMQPSESFFNNNVAKWMEYAQKEVSYLQRAYPNMDMYAVLEEKDAGRFIDYMVHNVIVNAPQHVISMAGALYGAAPLALGILALSAASEGAKQAREANVKPLAVGINALAHGVYEYGAEMMGTQNFIKEAVELVSKKYGKEVAKKMAKTVFYIITNGMFAEGTEEFATTLSQDWASFCTGADKKYSIVDSLKRAFEASLVGALSGGFMSSPAAINEGINRKAKSLKDQINDAQTDIDNVENGLSKDSNIVKDFKQSDAGQEIQSDGTSKASTDALSENVKSVRSEINARSEKLNDEIIRPKTIEIDTIQEKIDNLGYDEGTVEVKAELKEQIIELQEDIENALTEHRKAMDEFTNDLLEKAYAKAQEKGVDLGEFSEDWQDFEDSVKVVIDEAMQTDLHDNQTVGEVIDSVVSKYLPQVETPTTVQTPKFNNTEDALAYGESIKDNAEAIKSLQSDRDSALMNVGRIKEEYQRTKDKSLQQELMNASVEAQFYREALEAAGVATENITQSYDDLVKKTGNESSSVQESALIQEAKKYNSAEDFVKGKKSLTLDVEVEQNEMANNRYRNYIEKEGYKYKGVFKGSDGVSRILYEDNNGNMHEMFAMDIGKKGAAQEIVENNPDGSDIPPLLTVSAKIYTEAELTDIWNKSQDQPTAVQESAGEYGVPQFYSALTQAAQSLPQEKGTSEQFMNMLKKQPGVKAEEIELTGLEEWIAGRKDVTKQEIVDFLEGAKVEVRTVEKAEEEKWSYKASDEYFSNREDAEASAMSARDAYIEELDGRFTIGSEDIDEDNGTEQVYKIYDSQYGGEQYSTEEYETEEDAQDALDKILEEKVDEGNYFDVNYYVEGERQTKFSEYTHPGGENYREVLVTLPSAKIKKPYEQWLKENFYGEDRPEARKLYAEQIDEKATPFRSTHFDEPNIVVHLRLNDRVDADGNKIFFIEEIQSDLHQAGRKKGYAENTIEGLKKYLKGLESERKLPFVYQDSIAEEIFKEKDSPLWRSYMADSVPSAPFKKTWHELALKKALQIAIEGGYDKIAWTTGEMQVERYKEALRKAVDKIEWTKTQDGIQLVGYKNGEQVVDTTEKENSVSDAIGKSMGEQIINNPDQSGVIEGDDITISDTGMAGFYDNILPKAAEKLARKYDKEAKVGKTKIDTVNYEPTREEREQARINGDNPYRVDKKYDVWSIDISDTIKNGITTQGIPLFEPQTPYTQMENDFESKKTQEFEETDSTKEEKEHAYGKLETARQVMQDFFQRAYTAGRAPWRAAKHMFNMMKSRGFVDTVGIPVNNAQDVANVAALFRNPRFEILQFVFVKGGKIVKHIASTSNMPHGVEAEKIIARAYAISQKTGADGIYIAHNHPTGNIKPSPKNDIPFTKSMSGIFGDVLKGHLVLNGDKFSIINPDLSVTQSSYTMEQLEYIHPTDTITSQEHAAMIASKNMKQGKDTVIFRDRAGNVVSVDYVGEGRNLSKYIKDSLKGYSADTYIIVTTKNRSELPYSKLPQGCVDILCEFDNESVDYDSLRVRGAVSENFGEPIYSKQEIMIQEEQSPYSVEDHEKERETWEKYVDAKARIAEKQKQAENKRKAEQLKTDLKEGRLNPQHSEDIQKFLIENMNIDQAEEVLKIRQEERKKFIYDVKAMGGIAPYANGYMREEYRENVPLYLRSKNGLSPDDVARSLLSAGYNIESDGQLFDYIKNMVKPIEISSEKQRIAEAKKALSAIFKYTDLLAKQNYNIIKQYNDKLGKPVKPIKSIIRDNVSQKAVGEDIKGLREQMKRLEKETANAFREGRYQEAERLTKKYKEAKEKQSTLRKERALFKKYIGQILGVDTKKMEKRYADEIKALQNLVDPSVPSKKTVANINSTIDYLRNNPDSELPTHVYEDLARVHKLNRSNATLAEFESIANAVQHLVRLQEMKNQLRIKQRNVEFNNAVDSIIAEMRPEKEIKDGLVKRFFIATGGEKAGRAWESIANPIWDFLTRSQEHYDVLVESIAGDNSVMYDVFHVQIKDGQRVKIQLIDKYSDFFANMVQEKIAELRRNNVIEKAPDDLYNWSNEKIKVEGTSEEFTHGERVSIYLHSMNEQNSQHLVQGYAKQGKRFVIKKWRDGELKRILETIDPVEKAIAEVQWQLGDMTYNDMNKVFKQKNGYDLPKVENYYGIDVADDTLTPRQKEQKRMEELRATFVRPGIPKGRLKERVGADQPLVIHNYFDALADLIQFSSTYTGLEIPISNAARVLESDVVSNRIKTAYGENVYKYIREGLLDIAGADKINDSRDRLALTIKNVRTMKAFAINVRVWLKQVLSLPLYNVYVKGEYLFKGANDLINNPQKTMEFLKAVSPEFNARVKRGFQQDLNDKYITENAEKLARFGKLSYSDMAMYGIGFMDSLTVATGMMSAIHQKMDELQNSGLSYGDKLEKAVRFAETVTNNTQPTFAKEHLNSLSRSKNFFWRNFAAFGTATNAMYNLVIRTGREYSRNPNQENGEKFVKALLYTTVVNAGGVFAIEEAWAMLWSLALGDDDEEDTSAFWRFVGTLANTIFGMVYGLREVGGGISSKLTKGYSFDATNALYDGMNFITETFVRAIKAISDGEPEKLDTAAVEIIDTFSTLFYKIPGISKSYKTFKRINDSLGLI